MSKQTEITLHVQTELIRALRYLTLRILAYDVFMLFDACFTFKENIVV